MKRRREQFIRDFFIILASIAFAVFMVRSGMIHVLVSQLDNMKYLGIFVAGMLFTSVFTTAPAIAALGEFAQENSLLLVALIAAPGAVLGDYILFRFFKNRFSEDVVYLMKVSKIRRLPAIFRTKLFHGFTIFIGAIIIASPLPDELGLMLLGFSKTKNRIFFAVSLIFNTIGIIAIGLAARSLAW